MANQWLTGAGTPSTGIGQVTDYYRDTVNNLVYYRENVFTWTVVPAFTPNPDGIGTTWLHGNVPPLTGQGSDGDYYYDEVQLIVYRKDGATWVPKGSLDFIGLYGVQWGNGLGAPADTVPLNNLPAGSFYLDVETSDIYFKPPSMTWELKGQLGGGGGGGGGSSINLITTLEGVEELDVTSAVTPSVIYDLDTLKADLASPVFTGAPTAPTPQTEPSLDNSTKLATTEFVNTVANAAITTANNYADGLVVGLWKDQGNFDASLGSWPTASNTIGSVPILSGFLWKVSVGGTLTGGVVVDIGDAIRALVDSAGNTAINWAVIEGNDGYVPENKANKAIDLTLPDDTKYPTTLAVSTALSGKQASDATLTALAAFNSNGVMVQTATDTFTSRTITGTASQVTVTNGDGVGGNPTISLPASGVTAETYGSATQVPVTTYNAQGIATSVTLATIETPTTFSDSDFRIQDNGDATKQLALEVNAITTGTIRTVAMPDFDVSLGEINRRYAANRYSYISEDFMGEHTRGPFVVTLPSVGFTQALYGTQSQDTGGGGNGVTGAFTFTGNQAGDLIITDCLTAPTIPRYGVSAITKSSYSTQVRFFLFNNINSTLATETFFYLGFSDNSSSTAPGFPSSGPNWLGVGYDHATGLLTLKTSNSGTTSTTSVAIPGFVTESDAASGFILQLNWKYNAVTATLRTDNLNINATLTLSTNIPTNALMLIFKGHIKCPPSGVASSIYADFIDLLCTYDATGSYKRNLLS